MKLCTNFNMTANYYNDKLTLKLKKNYFNKWEQMWRKPAVVLRHKDKSFRENGNILRYIFKNAFHL